MPARPRVRPARGHLVQLLQLLPGGARSACGSGPALADAVAQLAAVFDGTVLEWCLEREGELCKVEELHESWARLAWQIPGWIRSRARDALHELGISDDPIEFLLLAIEFVLQWRGVRELEVFGGLVHEVLEEEDDVLEFGVIAWDLALDVDDW